MATMILSAAGSSFAGAAGGSFLGIGGATLGRTIGAVAGGLIDQKILGRGSQPVETGRLERIRLQGGGEGGSIPRLYGRMRVGGQLIWSSRFQEHVDESREGGKGGGQKTRSFRYSISFAVALCQGPVRRVGRVWADGNEISLADYSYRLHRGFPGQAPDPLIDALEDGAPGFRDTAYLVFEDMPLDQFGNRIPQLNIEVYREPKAETEGMDPAEAAPPLSELVRGVAMSPGSGEFSLETRKVRRLIGPGQTAFENVNTIAERPDLMLGLDQLQAEAPNCGAVSLIVSWFGDDLRCAECDIRPCVETSDKETAPSNWVVGGEGRSAAKVVSLDAEERPIYGGTPSDESVIRSIQEMNARGLKVMFYPFILMDVPADNALTNPWSGQAGQPPFPWRGRITLDRASGVAGSSDKTAAAAAEVAAFFGGAQPGHFTQNGETVSYSGPAEWSFRRFILHYANLCALAGGVDSFCIGSEMRSLTQVRSSASGYPSVQRLKSLASDVRGVLGSGTRIGYAADWSEYFGHHPDDGSGDHFFHLDPLWSDDDIDFVGIDNYLPLSDWRYRDGHADEGAGSVYSLAYLGGNVEGGEGFDWFYADGAARASQVRTPINDTAAGEDWVFRPKDLRSWWENAHHNRPGGARNAAPTSWTPRSKPIWLTEIGCPAVDLGANQPNVFVDPKSSENALPYYSRGVRDDYMQRRYLQAALDHWDDPAANPVSSLYGGRMINLNRTFVWTWDARPWPDFPNREAVWSDGPNHRLGHWLTGRLGAASLADVVAEICRASELNDFDVTMLHGVVHGYLWDGADTARSALQPLMTAYAFDAAESGGEIVFRHRDRPADGVMSADMALTSSEGGAEIEFVRDPEGDLPRAIRFSYLDGERDYESGAVEAAAPGGGATRVERVDASLTLDSGAAQEIADRFLMEARAGRESVEAACARSLLAIEPGDIVTLTGTPGDPKYRIDRIDDESGRRVTLSRVESRSYGRFARPPRKPTAAKIAPAAPVGSVWLDLPSITGDEAGPRVAAYASPWTSAASLLVDDGAGQHVDALRLPRPAVAGRTETDFPGQHPFLWTHGASLDVVLDSGSLSAATELSVLNGGNLAALETPEGEWEILQFSGAELVGPNRWRLSRFLRGRFGTEAFIADPTPTGARFVMLDSAIGVVASPSGFRGVVRNWRIGPSRKPYTHDSYTDFTAVDRGVRLRPFAPAHLRAVRNLTGDITVSWVRRARVDGDTWAMVDPPLGEAEERYRVRIGGFRTEDAFAPTWTYTVADQTADGAVGAIVVSVAQFSDQYGPGPESEVIINV